ncbi:MAG: polymer-forming cytoskeletal protein [Spirochaetales bacterium]|nr:polymer-forming cytoskeletal protein [Spirochaetales bacterium]
MSNYLSEDGTFINSLIGEGTVFKGDLSLNGLLRIDGDFSGTVKTDGKVLIGKNGRAEATVIAGTVVVGGVLKGNINASEKVVILSTGMLIGNITAPRLLVEDGVLLNGSCNIVPKTTSRVELESVPEPDIATRRSFFFSLSNKEKKMETASSWKE